MIGLLMLGQQAVLPSFTSRMNLNLNMNKSDRFIDIDFDRAALIYS